MPIKTVLFNLLNQFRKNSIPKKLKQNQSQLDNSQLQVIEDSIKTHYHKGWRSQDKYTPEAYAEDLKNHLSIRLERDRTLYIPWLSKTIELRSAKILEIGCGTGASTIALAEQGAQITAIDIDNDAIQVAKDRCKVYGVSVNFICGNAIELKNQLQDQNFDLIIFYACLEHMTYEERIESLKSYFDLLPKGAFMSIVDTPNRLWYYDDHTALLPAYNWLPNRLAFDYAKFSSRTNFNELYGEYTEDNFLHFLRAGRGFSFHEIEIALNKPISEINTVSYLKPTVVPFSKKSKFHRFLKMIFPNTNHGYLYPYLDIIIKK